MIMIDDRAKVVTKSRNVDQDCLSFAHRLNTEMTTRNISQADLARLMKVSRSAVNWWCQGKTYPSIENAKQLASLLRVTPEYLIFNVKITPQERKTTPVPIYQYHKGKQIEIDQLTLPNEFVARELHDIKDLRGAAIYSNGQPGMIALVDAHDKELTKEPREMLLDTGDSFMPATVRRNKSKITITDHRHDVTSIVSARDLHIVGHVVAELHMSSTT
jgi:transcriptional regulator with XRE-family HTH domain